MYEEMLRAVSDKADQLGVRVHPTTVICDFEQSVVVAIAAVLEPRVKKTERTLKCFAGSWMGWLSCQSTKCETIWPTYARVCQTALVSSISLIILMPHTCWDWLAVSNVQSTAAEWWLAFVYVVCPPCFHRRSGRDDDIDTTCFLEGVGHFDSIGITMIFELWF